MEIFGTFQKENFTWTGINVHHQLHSARIWYQVAKPEIRFCQVFTSCNFFRLVLTFLEGEMAKQSLKKLLEVYSCVNQ